VSSIQQIKQQKRAIISRYATSDNVQAWLQVLTTLVPLGLLWWAAVLSIDVSYWLTAATILLISLFTLRVLVLMHECGHGSLFHSCWLNRTLGFVFGVISGMPQYVWSQHHDFHHANNGNWEKYRGPLTTPSVAEFAAMSAAQQRMYCRTRHIAVAPLGGFIYLIFNPRFNWLKGSVSLVMHMVRGKLARPSMSLRTIAAGFQTRYWQSASEYWHMSWNNIVLLSLWAVMCWAIGPAVFFTLYLLSVSLAGGGGIVLFTVQHNFEHAYAADGKHWDYDIGAIDGTSFLLLPGWLNWFTANIAYHHVHHLSAKIPNYLLVACHNEYQSLFTRVTRVKLSEIPGSLKCILWDERAQRIISVAEFKRQQALSAA
jgi:omega-6 fatty acid desaturase (delta-12 desaturase)